MKLGLNLSFAVKRWLEPEYLAHIIREEIGVEYIQFTWDLIDPWWPIKMRDDLARSWGNAFKKEGLQLMGTFGGLAAYTYPQLLAPTKEMRETSLEFFKRAIDMTIAMGTDCIGTPLGGMDHGDAYDSGRRRESYLEALDLLRELASYGQSVGLNKIIVEPTPLYTEFPGTPDDCLSFMKDLEGTTAIPVELLLDWGHALMKPYVKQDAKVDVWLDRCNGYIDSFHLQQSDGQLDRHWGFTTEGIIDVREIWKAMKKYGLKDRISFVELIYPFEMPDEQVLSDVKETMRILFNAVGGIR